jgi:MSHA biogenesis protein MshK
MADGMKIRDQESGVRNQWDGAVAPHLVIVVFCLLSSVFCHAEDLPDPTRIPAIIVAPVAAANAEAQPAGLQSILISKDRRAAIIDGETVELGGKHGDAKLIEVNEGSVVLSNLQGRKVLTLFPDVKITGKKVAKEQMSPLEAKAQPGKKKSGTAARKEKK